MLEGLISRLEDASKISEQKAWDYAISGRIIGNKIVRLILDQLDEGINSDDKIIGIYSQATQEITDGRKKAGDPYNLDDTGFFRSTISILRHSDYIAVQANGQKGNENIIDKYTIKIIELTQDNIVILRGILLDEYLKYVKNVLQIN